MSRLRFLAILPLIIVPIAVHAASAHTVSACSYTYRVQFTYVNHRRVTVEIYKPRGPGKFPLVFMLPGAAGALTVHSQRPPAMDNFGEKALAGSCFTVVLPHYLEALGMKSLTNRSEMVSDFPRLVQIVDLLLNRVEVMAPAPGRPVFLFGDSLGGFLATVLAFQRSDVAAVSVVSAGRPPGYRFQRTGLLRMLISQGDADHIVAPSMARALRQYCRAHRIPVKLDMYPSTSHYLVGRFRREVVDHTIKFFRADMEVAGACD